MIVLGYLFVVITVIGECFLDRWIIKKIDEDGIRTKIEDALLHWAQLPLRGIALLAPAYWLMPGNWFHNWVALAAFYWLLFDVVINVFVLKQPAFYIGTTARVDKWARKVFRTTRVYFFIRVTLVGITLFYLL